MVGGLDPDGSTDNIGFTTFNDFRDRTCAFESLVAIRSWSPTLMADGDAERVPAMRVRLNFFSMFGARPALGWDFHAADDAQDRYRVLMLSDGLWRRRFGASSGTRFYVHKPFTASEYP